MLMWIAMFGGLHVYLSVLKTGENLRESSGWTVMSTGSGRCCNVWESRLVSESITHHTNKTSPLGDSLYIPSSMGKAHQEHVKSP